MAMSIVALNKKARFDYEIIKEFEAGLVLTGTEVKSIRNGHLQLQESFIQVKNCEVFLIGSHLRHYEQGTIWNVDENRTRKLLLNKKEINELIEGISKDGFTIVPLDCHFSKNKAKLKIALVRGKKNYDKRESLKRKDIERDIKRELKV